MDYVFHAAGSVGAAGVGFSRQLDSIVETMILTLRVLQAAHEAGVERILLFGSSTAYPLADHPVREEELWTGEPPASYFGYGWMRRYIERIGEFVAGNSKLRVALARPSAVYGPGDNFSPTGGHVIPALIRRAVAREDPFVVWGTGDEVRDFLHVDDLAAGCVALLDRHAACDPVNIGYGSPAKVRDVVRVILDAAGYHPEVVYDASKPTTIPVRIVDTRKAGELIGFQPRIPLDEGLRATVRWFRESLTN
jgi:GDP-L-fucose synthase